MCLEYIHQIVIQSPWENAILIMIKFIITAHMPLTPSQASTLFHTIHRLAPHDSEAYEKIHADFVRHDNDALINDVNAPCPNQWDFTIDATLYAQVVGELRKNGITQTAIENTAGITLQKDGGLHIDMRSLAPLINTPDRGVTSPSR